jgi:hypothetical protein
LRGAVQISQWQNFSRSRDEKWCRFSENPRNQTSKIQEQKIGDFAEEKHLKLNGNVDVGAGLSQIQRHGSNLPPSSAAG